MSYGYNQPPYGQPPQFPGSEQQYPGYGPPQPQYGQPAPQEPGGFPPPMPGGQYYPPPGSGPPGYGNYAPPPGPNYGAPPPLPGNRPPSAQYGGAPPPTNQYAFPGGPSPGQNGPPPHSQYAPPLGPPLGQNAPPIPQYRGPSPAQHGPPVHSPYGAPAGPPPGSYGAPPAQYGQQAGYNYYSQPSQIYLGTPIPLTPSNKLVPDPPVPNYNAASDAESVHKATKGFGTNENQLIKTISPLSALQVNALATEFKRLKGLDIARVLESEVGGWFGMGLRGVILGPVGWDVELVHRAVAGLGTHEDLLNEILLSRTNEELNILKAAYRERYNTTLEQDVEKDLSMKTKRLFVMVLSASRVPDTVPVNMAQVDADVHDLYKAGTGTKGTNETVFCHILSNRSQPHLSAICNAYQFKHKMTLTRAIKKEFSGHMKDALLYIAHGAKREGNGVWRDAKLMEKAMAGMGTKDERLVWRIVRAHWDRRRMEAIKMAYQSKYKKALASRVKGETGGDYQKLMLALIG